MEWIFTKDGDWCKRWDDFITSTPRGNHLILSDWLRSYEAYGFDFELCIGLIDGNITGGYGAIIAKAPFLKFYIAPHGPVLLNGQERYLATTMQQLKERAILLNCCYVQCSLPISDNYKILSHVYQPNIVNCIQTDFLNGKLFGHVYCSYGLNWIDLDNFESPEQLLKSLSSQVRRNIKIAYKNEVTHYFASSEEDIKQGYNLVEKTALEGNYPVRSYEDFKTTLNALIISKRGYFLLSKINGQINGASFFIYSGTYFTYIFGGTLKAKPDLKTGYLLHWETISKSFDLGLKGYNISLGGSKGVKNFKSKFGTETILYINPHYYSILKPYVFKLYYLLNKFLRKHKSILSKILKMLKINMRK